MTDQTLLEHSERMAKQEERMNTHQAKYESALDRLRADMAKRDAEAERRDVQRDAEAAKRDVQRDAEMAKRDAEAERRDVQRDAEMAKRDAEAERREAQRDADAAKRDKDNTRWQVGMWVAIVLIFGALIRWPF